MEFQGDDGSDLPVVDKINILLELQTCDAIQEWVQCIACTKWRKIPNDVDSKSLPEEWTCDLGRRKVTRGSKLPST